MKILFVHNNYASNNSGEEHAAQGLADLLEQKGHVVGWCRKSSDVIQGSLSNKIKAFFFGIYNPTAVKELRQKIHEFEPDIIQVQNVYPFISPAILPAINRIGIPVVMRCPNYRLFCPTGLHLDNRGNVCEKCLKGAREFNAITKNCESNVFKSTGYAIRNWFARSVWKLGKNMDAYIVQSEFQKKKFISNGIPERKLFIVPGLTPVLKLNRAEKPGKYVSFIGRVSTEKGIVEFLEAAKSLPTIPFAVVGSLDPSLKNLKDKSPANVSWTGFLSGKEYDEFYRESRIIVVPSKWYEGFPNVITRAMRHARPVITTNIGATQSIIDHGVNGLLVNPESAEELKKAIESLYFNESLCMSMGSNGLNKARTVYSNEVIYSQLMEAYNFALKSNN